MYFLYREQLSQPQIALEWHSSACRRRGEGKLGKIKGRKKNLEFRTVYGGFPTYDDRLRIRIPARFSFPGEASSVTSTCCFVGGAEFCWVRVLIIKYVYLFFSICWFVFYLNSQVQKYRYFFKSSLLNLTQKHNQFKER